MAKKVITTAQALIRALTDKTSKLRPAVERMNAAGIEILEVKKAGLAYQVSDFKNIMGGVEGAIVGSEPWNDEMFTIGKDLKIVARFGVGYDAVDIAAAKKHGIMATNVRVLELSNGVAELALGLTLAVYRNIARGCAELKGGTWNMLSGKQIRGKTVGIVGFGAIGQCFARIMGGFEAKLLACDPYPNKEMAAKLHVDIVPMDKLLAESDIVSLSAPNTKENRHMFNAATFAKMKTGSVFVNTARGAMVDEKALYDALTSGKLMGAGIDVWEQEPTPSNNPLLKLQNLVSLPHMAGENEESTAAMAMQNAEQIIAALSGKAPINLLNP